MTVTKMWCFVEGLSPPPAKKKKKTKSETQTGAVAHEVKHDFITIVSLITNSFLDDLNWNWASRPSSLHTQLTTQKKKWIPG